MHIPKILSTLAIIFIPAIGAWLWFVPVFWELSSDQTSFWEAIQSVFFQSDNQEFFLGDTTDLQGTIWVFDHFSKIVDGTATSVMPNLYAPIGFDIGLNTGFAWADAALAYPYVKWIGIPGFYNLHVFITLWINGILLSYLFKECRLSTPMALGLSGLCIHNDVVAEELLHGRPTQIHWWFHALFLIAILRLTTLRDHKHTNRWAILGGVMLAGSCLTYWFGGASLGFIAALVATMASISLPKRWKEHTLPRLQNGLVLAGTAIAIALVCTWRLSVHYLSGTDSLFEELQPTTWTTWSFLGRTIDITSVAHISSWESFVEAVERNTLPDTFWWLWGISLFPLAMKKRWPWIIGATLALFIPLPSAFNFGDTWVPTTNAFLHWIFPPMERCGFPERLVVTPILLIGVSFSLAWGDLERRTGKLSKVGQQIASLTIGIWLCSLALDGIPNKPTTSTLKADRDVLMVTETLPGGIIHIPVEEAGNAFIQQMFHQQPILTGPGADTVRPKKHRAYCEANSLLRALELLAAENHPLEPVFAEEDREKLQRDGFRWVQVDLRRSASPASAYIDLLGHDGLLRQNRHFLAIPLNSADATLLQSLEP